MPFREEAYISNVMIVKSLGIEDHKKLKVVFMPVCRNKGVEYKKKKNVKIIECSNDDRLKESVSRSKRMIFEYAFCNKFDFFFTGTLDKDKYDRYDLEKFHKDLTIWIRNLNRNYKCNIEYIFVPEKHKDGAFHIHGLVAGIPENMIKPFKIGEKMGKHIADKIKNNIDVYDWLQYHEKFGFCDLEEILNISRLSKYITKYITKDLVGNVVKGKQCFWHSKGLKSAEVIIKGRVGEIPFSFDFSNEHVSIKTFDDTDIIRNSLESLLLRRKSNECKSND